MRVFKIREEQRVMNTCQIERPSELVPAARFIRGSPQWTIFATFLDAADGTAKFLSTVARCTSRILIESTPRGNLHGRLGMKSISVTIVVWLTIASVGYGQTSKKAEQELLRANREYDEALVRRDIAVLERLYSDEFVYTTPDGEVRNRAQQLTFMRTGDLRLESGQSNDVRVRVYGNTAVMTGRFTATGKFRGKDIDIRERYTAVWVKREGRWRLVAEQGNLIKQQ